MQNRIHSKRHVEGTCICWDGWVMGMECENARTVHCWALVQTCPVPNKTLLEGWITLTRELQSLSDVCSTINTSLWPQPIVTATENAWKQSVVRQPAHSAVTLRADNAVSSSERKPSTLRVSSSVPSSPRSFSLDPLGNIRRGF